MLSRSFSAELRSLAAAGRSMVLYTAGCLSAQTYTEPAEVLLRHARPRVAGVVDEKIRVGSLAEVDPWAWAGPVPVARRALDLLDEGRDLVVSVDLPPTTALFERHHDELVEVADAGHRVVNLLHETIDHPNIVNLRRFTPDQRLDTTTDEATATRIAVVGADPAAPTLTTSLTLTRALVEAGWAANLAPTSGPGIVAAGFGRCLDAVPPAHTAGVLQAVIHTVEAEAEVVVVEGQGALDDPANAPLAATISHTTRSRYHILCHRPPSPAPPPAATSTAGGGPPGGDSGNSGADGGNAGENGDTPDATGELAATLTEAAARHEALHRAGGFRSTLLGVALDTSGLDPLDARRQLDAARSLGVPAVDAGADLSPLVAAFGILTGEVRS